MKFGNPLLIFQADSQTEKAENNVSVNLNLNLIQICGKFQLFCEEGLVKIVTIWPQGQSRREIKVGLIPGFVLMQ